MRSNIRVQAAPSGQLFLKINPNAYSQSAIRAVASPPKPSHIYSSAFTGRIRFANGMPTLKEAAPVWDCQFHNGLRTCMADELPWTSHPNEGAHFLFGSPVHDSFNQTLIRNFL